MIKVLIADDHQLMREGLRKILISAPGIALAGCAADGDQAMAMLEEVEVDVLLLDLSMPGTGGVALIAQLHARSPQVAILVLTMHDEKHYAVRSIRAGALGFITKETASSNVLLNAIRSVAAGRPVVSEAVAALLAMHVVPGGGQRAHTLLSARERQVFDMLVGGQKLTAIGIALGLSIKTVSTYRTRILQKLNLDSLPAMIQYAVEEQLIEVAPSPPPRTRPQLAYQLRPARPAPVAPSHPVAVPDAGERRRCTLTESKVNVALILCDMLGSEDARTYLAAAGVPDNVATRVVSQRAHCRRRPDDPVGTDLAEELVGGVRSGA